VKSKEQEIQYSRTDSTNSKKKEKKSRSREFISQPYLPAHIRFTAGSSKADPCRRLPENEAHPSLTRGPQFVDKTSNSLGLSENDEYTPPQNADDESISLHEYPKLIKSASTNPLKPEGDKSPELERSLPDQGSNHTSSEDSLPEIGVTSPETPGPLPPLVVQDEGKFIHVMSRSVRYPFSDVRRFYFPDSMVDWKVLL